MTTTNNFLFVNILRFLQKHRWLIAGAVLCLLVVFMLIRVVWRQAGDDRWDQVVAEGVIRVGMDPSYPPFEYVDGEGRLVGFDVDLAEEIGARLGLGITYRGIAYDGLYDSLATGQVDLLISGLVPAYAYEAKADFSVPYFNAGETLLVPLDSVINGMTDMDGYQLAVEYGSGGDVEAREWERRLSDLQIVRHDDPSSAIQSLLDGDVEGVLVDGISAREAIGRHPEIRLAEVVTDVLFAVATPPGSPQLLSEVNRVITSMLEDGTVDRLTEIWLSSELP